MAHTVYSCVAYVPLKITTITRLVHSLMHLQLGELYNPTSTNRLIFLCFFGVKNEV